MFERKFASIGCMPTSEIPVIPRSGDSYGPMVVMKELLLNDRAHDLNKIPQLSRFSPRKWNSMFAETEKKVTGIHWHLRWDNIETRRDQALTAVLRQNFLKTTWRRAPSKAMLRKRRQLSQCWKRVMNSNIFILEVDTVDAVRRNSAILFSPRQPRATPWTGRGAKLPN